MRKLEHCPRCGNAFDASPSNALNGSDNVFDGRPASELAVAHVCQTPHCVFVHLDDWRSRPDEVLARIAHLGHLYLKGQERAEEAKAERKAELRAQAEERRAVRERWAEEVRKEQQSLEERAQRLRWNHEAYVQSSPQPKRIRRSPGRRRFLRDWKATSEVYAMMNGAA